MLEYRVRRLPAARAAAPRGSGRPARGSRGSRRGAARDVTPVRRATGRRRIVPIRTGARGPHRRRRRVGGLVVRRLDRRRSVRCRARARASRRDRALLGVAHPAWTRTGGAHLRRHRPRRVPRAGRRQRVHQRHGPVEPAPGRRPRRRYAATPTSRRSRAGSDSPTRSSTATTPTTGVYEQFAGFYALEPLLIARRGAAPPVAADLLLGRDARRTAHRSSSRPTC